MNVGRFIPEIIRIVQALQMADCETAATPANWIVNQPIIQQIPKTFKALEERNNQIQENNNGMSWYLSFKEPSEKCKNDVDKCEKNL